MLIKGSSYYNENNTLIYEDIKVYIVKDLEDL